MFGEFLTAILRSTYLQSVRGQLEQVNTNNPSLNDYRNNNPLELIGVNFKQIDYESNIYINQEQRDLLDTYYKDETIFIPTHWYPKGQCIDMPNLPNPILIRLITTSEYYPFIHCMRMIKQKFGHTSPWGKILDLKKELIAKDEEVKELLEDIAVENENSPIWKIKLLASGYNKTEINLSTYVEHVYDDWVKFLNLENKNNIPWTIIDPIHLITGNDGAIARIYSITGVMLDKDSLIDYHNRNLRLIENTIGLTFNDLLTIPKEEWIARLIEYGIRKYIS